MKARRLAVRTMALMLVGGVGLALGGGAIVHQAASPGGDDWPQYRHDAQSTWANPGTFTAADVASLQTLWTKRVGASGYSEPMLVGDTIYVTTAGRGRVWAFNANTGATRWMRDLNAITTGSCGSATFGITGAPAVVNHVVYVASPDGNVYALRDTDGTTIWRSTPLIADPNNEEVIQASPIVSTAMGKIYIGTASASENCLPSGKIAAIDISTGSVISKMVPVNTKKGSSIWSSITVDEATRRVFATTGNAPAGPRDDPYSQAFVAYDAHTLTVLDHWQNPAGNATEDIDFGASPTLFNDANGRPLVAAANKDGWLYVLDRRDLAKGPVWKYRLAVAGGPVSGKGSLVAPTFANGFLYGAGGQTPAGEPGSVVAFNPTTGAVLWKHVTPGYVLAGMPAVGDILVVAVNAVGNATHTIQMLDAATGSSLRDFTGPNPVWGAPTAARGLIMWIDTLSNLTVMTAPGERGDGGAPDAGTPDAGTPDAGTPDAGTPDAGTPDAGTPGMLFTDSLTGSGSLGPNWTDCGGSFSRDTTDSDPTAGTSCAVATVNTPLGTTAAVDIQPSASSFYSGLILRADPAMPQKNHYLGYVNGTGLVWISKRLAWNYTHSGGGTTKIDISKPHRLAFSVSGTSPVKLTLAVDGVVAATAVDSSAPLTSGGAGIFARDPQGAAFGNFTLETP